MPEIKKNLNKIQFIIGAIILLATVLWLFFAFNNKPLDFDAMLKRADTYAEQGQIAFAIEEYNRLLSLYPENYDVHMNLAELYKKIDEIDHAKVEYIMAIRMGHKYRHEAYIELAKIYCDENKYHIVKDIIEEIKTARNYTTVEEIGNIYFEWGNKLKITDKPDAIRKFKESRKYYKKVKSKSDKKALENIFELYAEISNELIESKQYDEATKILKLSIDYADNALARYHLANIYLEQGMEDKALKEFSNAFKLDPEVAETGAYVGLLIKKAIDLKDQGDDVTSEYYYKKAKQLDSRVDVPPNPDRRILFKLIATRVNEDMDNDIIVPGITFRLINVSPDIIDNLKVKIVFLKKDRPVSSEVIIVADEENTLKGDSESPELQAYSNSPIRHVFDDHELNVKVYISQHTPDKWKLFRYIEIPRERKPVRLVE